MNERVPLNWIGFIQLENHLGETFIVNIKFHFVFDGKYFEKLEYDFRTAELASLTVVTLALLNKQDTFMVDWDK